MLRIEGLDVAIGPVGILRNVSLEVPSAKFAGLIGRNGAGKTTLMRSIMGILAARNGSIHFDGSTLDTVPTHMRARAGIGYMPEDRRLVPTLTVEENVLIPAWALEGRRVAAAPRAAAAPGERSTKACAPDAAGAIRATG